MDSLLANYASDDDDDRKDSKPPSAPSSKPSSFFSSLPPPKSFPPPPSSSLPSVKSHQPNPSPNLQTLNGNRSNQDLERKPTTNFPRSSSSSLFSSLPPPKSLPSNPRKDAPSDLNPKKIVQFTLPLNPSLLKSSDPDADDDEENKERKRSKNSSNSAAPKALSSMLPAPKNSLCLAPTAASRKTIVESSGGFETKQERSDLQSYGVPKAEGFELEQDKSNFENYGSFPVEKGTSDHEHYGSYDGSSGFGGSYASGGGGDYGSYAENWTDGSAAMAAVTKVPDVGRILGKRGRNEIPTEIIEVKQDELIKNRPREDQVKLTGIAFGPSYQPVSTSKGKPTKLHKRKHQIGSLFFDMKQKEMELAERRAKGFLTKAETQAKYGW